MAGLGRYGYAFRVASEALRGDKEVALVAVRKHGHALRWASEALQADKEVRMALPCLPFNTPRKLILHYKYHLASPLQGGSHGRSTEPRRREPHARGAVRRPGVHACLRSREQGAPDYLSSLCSPLFICRPEYLAVWADHVALFHCALQPYIPCLTPASRSFVVRG